MTGTYLVPASATSHLHQGDEHGVDRNRDHAGISTPTSAGLALPGSVTAATSAMVVDGTIVKADHRARRLDDLRQATDAIAAASRPRSGPRGHAERQRDGVDRQQPAPALG